jgi:hypothetical protein
VGFGTITKKIPSNAFGSNLPKTNSFSKKETLTTENMEVLDVGLASGEYFIWIHVQDFAEEEPV